MTEINRNIPALTRRKLRQEVNYACPVHGCASPFLSYHHFDPPWHIENNHNIEGMIALCLHHHKAADNGAYTVEQLKKLKKSPYLNSNDILSGEFAWKRENILFDVGGSYFLGATEIYTTQAERLVWLSFDEKQNICINFDIKDSNGNLAFSMTDNDWVISTSFDDIESHPSMKKLSFKDTKKEIQFSIEFNSYSKLQFQEKYKSIIEDYIIKDIISKISAAEIVICEVRGLLKYPFHIHMKENSTVLKNLVGPFSMYDGLIKFEKGVKIPNVTLNKNYIIGNGILIS
jgi:hypothetical protein